MGNNKIGAIFIVSAMALSGVGVSFAMWTTSINATGTVNTATFGIGWSTEPITVSGDTQGIIYGTESIDGYGNLVITIYNAYPCCDININYDIQLTGQVWATLYPLQFTYTNFDPTWIHSYTNPNGVIVTATAPYYGSITVHLGENAVPGSTYTFTVTASAHQYNEGNPPSGGKTLNLPTGVVNAVFGNPGRESYWDTLLSNVPGGYSVGNGLYVGWCVNEHTYIVPGDLYTVNLMSSYDSMNPWPGTYTYSWPCVNYIINHKQGTLDEIQAAIWYFIDGGYTGTDTTVWAMINDALAHGTNFIPQSGQWEAVLVIGNPDFQNGYHVQHTFIEVDP